MIEINRWEGNLQPELKTLSGRELYFKVAASLLDDATDKKQSLKLLSERMTDRSVRTRIREFQKLGLVDVVDRDDDARTKRLIPTVKFVRRLNHHLDMFKRICHNQFLLVDKS